MAFQDFAQDSVRSCNTTDTDTLDLHRYQYQ